MSFSPRQLTDLFRLGPNHPAKPGRLHRASGTVTVPCIFNRDNKDAALGDSMIETASPTALVQSSDIDESADLNLQFDICEIVLDSDRQPVLDANGDYTYTAPLYTYYLVIPKKNVNGTTLWILSEELP